MPMRFAGITDKGAIREENQDTYKIETFGELALAVVCDGVGGNQGGQTASRLAAEYMVSSVESAAALTGAPADSPPWDYLIALVSGAMSDANAAVYEYARTDPALNGMGTTAVAMLAVGGAAVVANIGDSRAYLLSGRTARQITKDHSIVQELVDSGVITKEESHTHPQSNVITRALGIDRSVTIDTFRVSLGSADGILLCSDGLTKHVRDEELGGIDLSDPKKAAIDLVTLAIGRGGTDNVTCVIAAR